MVSLVLRKCVKSNILTFSPGPEIIDQYVWFRNLAAREELRTCGNKELTFVTDLGMICGFLEA